MSDDYQQMSVSSSTALSVSELNRRVRMLLEQNFPFVMVEGELSNMAMPASGHWYFTLKDSAAQVRCAMFRNRNSRVRLKPREGLHVLLKARLSLYEGRGDYQLIVDSMEPLGEGALRQAFEALKQKLLEEGLFAPGHKQALPSLPRHIGIITSPSGAAVRDILSVLKRRFPAIPVTILPVTVQGESSAADMIAAIELANQRQGCLHDLDVLVLARGGGSLEDLWSFNDEKLARAIFASELPIVSAVGHETDFTISDFVADLRAATPSAAAELLSPDQLEMGKLFRSFRQHYLATMQDKLTQCRQQLSWLGKRLRHPGRRLQEQAQRLDDFEQRLQRAWSFQLQQKQAQLQKFAHKLQLHSPAVRIRRSTEHNRNLCQRLQKAMQQVLKDKHMQVLAPAQALHNLSPLAVLGRGYSISYDANRKIIRSVQGLQAGDIIKTRLHQGEITSKVSSISDSSDK